MSRSRLGATALIVGLSAAIACTVVRDAHAEEAPDHGYRPNVPLITSGFITFGIPYTISVFVGATSDREEDRALFIPLVGPWIDLATRRCPSLLGTCNGETAAKAGLIVDGIFQGLGVLTMASGFLWRSRSATSDRNSGVDFVTPWASATGGGLSAVGRF